MKDYKLLIPAIGLVAILLLSRKGQTTTTLSTLYSDRGLIPTNSNGYVPVSGSIWSSDDSYLGTNAPRGIRNNNAGNIKIANNNWLGKIPVINNTDGVFEQFDTYIYGVRAMIVLLRNYALNYGDNTINTIINRYSPDPNKDNYKSFVSTFTGIPINQPMDLQNKDTMRKLVQGMTRFENGRVLSDPVEIVTIDQFNNAYSIS